MVFHILFFITLTLTACGLFKEKETVRLSLPEKVWADVGNLDRIPVGREVLLVIEVPWNDRIVSFTVNGVEKKGEVNSYMYKFKIYQNTNVALKLESEVKDKKDKSNISSGKTPQEIVEGDIYNFDYMKRNIEPKYQGYNPRLPNKGVFGSEITHKSTEPELVNDKGILIGILDETKRVKIIATFTYENATGDLNIYVNVRKEAYKYTPFAFEKEIEENEKLSDTNLFEFKLVNDQEGDYYIFEGIKRN